MEVEVQPPYPFNQSLVSSEESEDDEQEEDIDLPAASWHPKPLGVSAETYRSTASVIRTGALQTCSKTALCGCFKREVIYYEHLRCTNLVIEKGA